MTRHAILASVALAAIICGGGSPCDAAEKESAAEKFVKSLQGDWRMTSRIENGRETDADSIKNRILTFGPDKYAIRDGKSLIVEVNFKVDAAKETIAIDITFSDGDVHKGIIKVDGDTLTFCLAEVERPTEFKTAKGDNRILGVYKRVKK